LQCDIIREEADKAPSVFVGRCADYILNGREKVIKVFIYADLPARIKRVAAHYGISEQDAKVLIYKTDKKRANYYNYYTSLKWGKSDNYNLMLDTSKIGTKGAAQIIGQYIKLLQNS
jgi:cytidylate kinase